MNYSNLSGHAFTDDLSIDELENMTSPETLPDSLIVTDGTVNISVN